MATHRKGSRLAPGSTAPLQTVVPAVSAEIGFDTTGGLQPSTLGNLAYISTSLGR